MEDKADMEDNRVKEVEEKFAAKIEALNAHIHMVERLHHEEAIKNGASAECCSCPSGCNNNGKCHVSGRCSDTGRTANGDSNKDCAEGCR
jgi:hypothetical protein